ncbi:putative serine/threonine-protein kinase WNK4 [Bienertia sinuspersici]
MSSENIEEVEKDPTGRYLRYSEILGEGSYKIVYKAFDEDNGIEVAWNKVELSEEILKSEKQLERLYAEARLLKSLNHENVLRCYHSWVDNEKKTFNMITELLTSGNLRQYRKKHNGVGIDNNNKAIKNWARQILKGLDYLHSHKPPIIHRDLKCENLFVNGNSGKVKIGDLGLATVLEHATACSVIGTPEFMAPELYEDEYNQLVDIYSFGMCMLQMITNEKPYSECSNSAQVYKKVCAGIKPAVLSKVTDLQLRQFIEKCIAPVSERLSAIELLTDPFLVSTTGDFSIPRCCPSVTGSVCSPKSLPAAEIKPKVIVKEKGAFKLQGEMAEGKDSISMILWITGLGGHAEKADFVFVPETDTNVSVAEEMERDLGLSHNDASSIADLIEEVISELVPADYYYKCCLAEAKGSSQISSSLYDQDNKSFRTQQLATSEIEISDKHEPEIQSECDDIITEKVPNSSVCHEPDHKSLLGVPSTSQNQDQKDENLETITRRGTEECCHEVASKGRPNFLKRLFVHCKN